jgi:uncharacterized protein (DUF302 family)
VKHFIHTVDTPKSFEAAVEAVEKKVVEKGFCIIHTYDVAATLKAQGLHRGPLTIIEVCNAHYADEVLKKDVSVALMLPCPIVVYTEGEQTFISTMRPVALAEFSPGSGLEEVAGQMETVFLQIVNEARG